MTRKRNGAAVSVLLVGNDPDSLERGASVLEEIDAEFEVTVESEAGEVLDRVADGGIDAVAGRSDLSAGALEILSVIAERERTVPCIVYGDPEGRTEEQSAGIGQYLTLAERIRTAVDTDDTGRERAYVVTCADGVVGVLDGRGRFETVAPVAEKRLGYRPDELLGESFLDYVPPEDSDRIEAEFAAIRDDPARPPVELQFGGPDRGWTDGKAHGTGDLDDDLVDGLVESVREAATLRERAGELEAEIERLEEKRAELRHDVRNPMSVAASSLTLYRDTDDETYLEKVEQSLERIETLVSGESTDSDTADGSRPVSLEEVVRSAWEMVETESAQLCVESTGNLEADPDRLQRVFENLIRNAIEHGGSDVQIRVGTSESAVYFEDDGPGIPEDEREAIFEAGYTSTRDQSGLGLHIVENVIREHGWEIRVTEGEAGGARFEITGITFRPAVHG